MATNKDKIEVEIPHLPIDEMISEERAKTFRKILKKRNNQLTIVVENCHDPHNATAIIRSCDAFGVDTVHIITDKHSFKINNRVSKGTHNYVNIEIHKNINDTYKALKAQDYTILASDLGAGKILNTQEVYEMYEKKKVALVFGEESLGLTKEASENADGLFLIPMVGVTQSLNVSVAVAVTTYAIREKELCHNENGNLTLEEQTERYAHWVKRKRGIAVDRVMKDYKGQEMELEIYSDKNQLK
ncbi:MAG: RNA methyltransferase [Planctomycetota bacterium]|nr:MAG: RNA methyltransferase [Planctomycetota bacterium]